MLNEKLRNKSIKEVAAYLAQHMEFNTNEILKVLTKFAMHYTENGLVYVCGDAIIFNWDDGRFEGIDVRRKRYLQHKACENLINPEFAYVGEEVIWFSRNKNFKVVGEV